MSVTQGRSVYRPIRAKVFFNEIAGRADESPYQLAEILTEMQRWNILPEVFMVGPESRVKEAVRSALHRGIHLIVTAGGDGTIHSVAEGLIGSSATLGIIPIGTRNNLAFNLGIPEGIADAVALLRTGRRIKIDAAYLRSKRINHFFLEAASLGLVSDLYPAADEIQHGNLTQIGNLISTFVTSTPTRMRAILDRRDLLDENAYMMLITNMAYIGPHFQIDPEVFWNDGYLDLFVFSEMSKVDLVSFAIQSTGGETTDKRVKHYRTRQLMIHSNPELGVLADGVPIDEGPIAIRIQPHALAVMAGPVGVTKGELPVDSGRQAQ